MREAEACTGDLATYPAECGSFKFNRLSKLRHQFPALPNHCHLATAVTNSRSLVVQGQATWKFIHQSDCNLQEEIVVPRELTIGISQPTTCVATLSSFRNWTDHVANGGEACESGNYLAILILTWAYIFSKALVEKQGESMHYSNFSVPIVNDQLDDAEAVGLFVDAGQVDAAEVRWLEAVSAPGQGWNAVVSRPTYLSLWCVTYQGGPRFVVKVSTILSSVRDGGQSHPPSSKQALAPEIQLSLTMFPSQHTLLDLRVAGSYPVWMESLLSGRQPVS